MWRTNEAFREGIHNIWQGIVESVEWATNKVIDGINWIIDKINAIPFINIKTIGHVEWSEKSKQQKLDNFKESGGALQVSKDSPLSAKGYNTPLIDGSYKTGLDFVPYDGFVAELHKGERVLTAEENKLYSNNFNKQSEGRIFKSINNKSVNNNNSKSSINTNTNTSAINLNVTVNYSGNGSNSDINSLAEMVAKVIIEKLKVMKLNVV